MYKVKVFIGNDQQGRYVLKSGTNEHQIFTTSDAAYMFATKLRNESSIGVWCKVVTE